MSSSNCQAVSRSNWDNVPSSIISNILSSATVTGIISWVLPLHGVAVTAFKCCGAGLAMITGTSIFIALAAKGEGKDPAKEVSRTAFEAAVTIKKFTQRNYQKTSRNIAIAYQVFQELQQTKNPQPQNSTKIQEAIGYATWFSMKTISAIKGACAYSNEWGGQRNAIYTGVALAAISQAITGSSPLTNITIATTSAALVGIAAKVLNKKQKICNEIPLLNEGNPQLAISLLPPSQEKIEEGAGISDGKKEESPLREEPFPSIEIKEGEEISDGKQENTPEVSNSNSLMSAPLLNPTEMNETGSDIKKE